MMTRCVRPRAGAASLAAWPLIPYMRANLRDQASHARARRRDHRRRAHAIARRPAAPRAGAGATPLYTIPNPVDMTRARRRRTTRRRGRSPSPYVLYAGKLATNKGVQFLLQAVRATPASRGRSSSSATARCAPSSKPTRARAGIDVRVLGLARSRDEVLAWMRHATLLAFPSYGPESLSRVLIEAAGARRADRRDGHRRHARHHPCRTSPGCSRPIRTASRAISRGSPRDERLRASLGAAARADVHARFAAAVGRRARRAGLSRAAAAASRVTHEPRAFASPSSPARSMPLHGVGGLERSVHDLVRHLAARGVDVTLITPPGVGVAAPTARDPFASPRITLRHVPYLTFPFANRRGTTILDRSTAYPSSAGARAGWRARLASRRARSTSSTASAPACSATRTARRARRRRSCSTRRASRSSARRRAHRRRLKRARLRAAAPGGAPLRAGGRLHHRDRRALEPTVARHLQPRPGQMRDDSRTASTSSRSTRARRARRRRGDSAAASRHRRRRDSCCSASAGSKHNKGFDVLAAALGARVAAGRAARGVRLALGASSAPARSSATIERAVGAAGSARTCCLRAARPTPTCTRGTKRRRSSCIRRATKAARSSRSRRWRTAARSSPRAPAACPTRSGPA